jgi:hypothetical protein
MTSTLSNPPHASTHAPGGTDAIDLTKLVPSAATFPTLPDPLYPAGCLFFGATEARLARSTGAAWVSVTAPLTGNSRPQVTVAASRPAANAVFNGMMHYATDTGEISVSNGSVWSTVGYVRPDPLVGMSEAPLFLDFTDTSVMTRGWSLLAGTTPTVLGGVLTPAANETVIVRANESVGDAEAVMQITFPGSVTSGKGYGVAFKATDANNYILVQVSTSGQIQVWKKVSGTWTQLQTAAVTVAPSTTYWVVGRMIGNTITAEWWTTDPAKGGNPTASAVVAITLGDITQFGVGVRGKIGFRFDAQAGVNIDNASFRPFPRQPRQQRVDVYTSSTTWYAPDAALTDPKATCRVIAVCAGQGGASGPRRPASTATSGGGGGAPGGVTDVVIPASSMGASGSVTIPTAGAGGAAVTTDATNGNNGGIPGSHTIVFTAAGAVKAYRSTTAPLGGSTSTGVGGAVPAATTWAMGGGGSGTVGSAGGATNWVAGQVPIGGAAGGGIDVGNNWKAGGTTGGFNETETGTSQGGATNGANGANGASNLGCKLWGSYMTGAGGGGGASGVGVAGGNGGNAGNYGGGGGGGGAAHDGFNSGAGGSGGAGIAILVWEWGG